MISQRISDFVTEFRDLTRTAANEEELRSAFAAAAISKLGIRDLKLERGRQDVRRNRVIIEFKDKGLFHGTKTSAKFGEALSQLVDKYIPEQARTDGRQRSDYIGVCFDGIHLAFVFIEADGRTRVSDLRPFDQRSAAALVLALDRDNRIELTPENLSDDFGPGSALASEVLGALWRHLNESLDAHVTRVEMLYEEWNDLFEQSTSLGRIGRSELGTYLESIGLPASADPTRVLFTLHTYHALVFKLLAAELVLANTIIPGTPREEYCFGTAALDDEALINSLERDIEESGLFRQVNLLNFIEGSFFSWYLVDPPSDLVEAIRAIMRRLSLYRLTGLQLARTRDIVKRAYQDLVPPALRHNIGEFFTPEWLVEFTLDRIGYAGPGILDRRILDPCCGSGNFLIHAINRFKAEARAAGWDAERILQAITDSIFGFDLNPLAVLTARVNYLIAISDLLATSSEVEIPVYQADAIYSPTVASPCEPCSARVYEIQTRQGTIHLELPEDLIQNNRLFARVCEIMERTIRNGDREDIFIATLNGEPSFAGDPQCSRWEPFLRDMFRKIEELERKNWNRIWCRIVRNYFASVAVGKCDYVAGNPPWVRWSELPEAYRERIKPTCQAYGVFSRDRFFGGNELDISGMITYSVADKWLRDDGGLLSFVITQTHFQSQSSGGLRNFEVRGVPLRVLSVDDFVQVRPWRDLGNKPAVLTLVKGSRTVYPVRYFKWKRTGRALIEEDSSWQEAQLCLQCEELEANPLSSPGQRWSILPPGRFEVLRVLDGADPRIRGRKGIVTDLNGAYFVEILGPGRLPNTVRVRNVPQEGRANVPPRTDEIELDLVYPLIKGAQNIRAFHATTSALHVIVPNRSIVKNGIPTVSEFASRYPGALRYFRAINTGGILEQRSTWKTRMRRQFEKRVKAGQLDPSDIPFYAIYDVGEYTFAPYKVVWAEMAGRFQAAVISTASVPFSCERKPIVPDHKVYFAAFDDPDYAHYVCAMLNSEPVRTFIDGFTIKIQVGSLFRFLRLPQYDPDLPECQVLVRCSREAHEALAAGEPPQCINEELINRTAECLLEMQGRT